MMMPMLEELPLMTNHFNVPFGATINHLTVEQKKFYKYLTRKIWFWHSFCLKKMSEGGWSNENSWFLIWKKRKNKVRGSRATRNESQGNHSFEMKMVRREQLILCITSWLIYRLTSVNGKGRNVFRFFVEIDETVRPNNVCLAFFYVRETFLWSRRRQK